APQCPRRHIRPGEKGRSAAASKTASDGKAENPTTAAIRAAYGQSANVGAFKEALAQEGIWLARANEKDVEDSTFAHYFAKERGKYAPEYRLGEYVAINTFGRVYRLNEANTGANYRAVNEFMKGCDNDTDIKSIHETRAEFAPPPRKDP